MLDAQHHPQIWAIKDHSNGQALLGCGTCLDRPTCGGLHAANGGADALSCMSMCRCEDPSTCFAVCPRAPSRYVRRLDEIGGFGFEDIPIAPAVALPTLPDFAELFEGNLAGSRPIRDLDHVAIPLSMALRKRGQRDQAKNAQELRRSFGADPSKGWIASGVERDPRVERLWRLHEPKSVYRAMKRAGIIFATTPNYSTYADVPRHDNLHAMKRIAWTWCHMLEAGLPAALHLNGRTDHDFERWAEFARRQVNLKAIAFEFLTGAKPIEDGHRYVRRLIDFTERSDRKNLLLVLRGGQQWEAALRPHFANILSIDSKAYFKTVKRQKLFVEHDGRVVYRSHRTESGAQIRALLRHNVSHRIEIRAGNALIPAQAEMAFDFTAASVPTQRQTDDKTPQFDLFAQ